MVILVDNELMFPKKKRIVDIDLIETVQKMECVVCGILPCDAHHLTTKGAGGGDTCDNLMPLCRWHHRKIHDYGVEKFMQLYPNVLDWLKNHGRDDLLTDFLQDYH